MTLQISARNQLTGKVSVVTPGSVNSEVSVALGNGQAVVAIITNESVAALKLVAEKPVTAIVKASSILLLVGEAKLSARNQLLGTVKAFTDGAVNSEVVVQLPGGAELVATVTLASRKSLGLAVGSPVTAVIKASSVLLAV